VSFTAITLHVGSQSVFIFVVISLSTQSGNFLIHTRTSHHAAVLTIASFCAAPVYGHSKSNSSEL
jgi:hypothetical protein